MTELRQSLVVVAAGLAAGALLGSVLRWAMTPEPAARPREVIAPTATPSVVVELPPEAVAPTPVTVESPVADDLSGYFPDPEMGSGVELPNDLTEGSPGRDDGAGSAHGIAAHPALPLLERLGSNDPGEVRDAARQLFRNHRRDPLVQEQCWLRLDQGYRRGRASWAHVDAMAWLCKIIGSSDEPRYRALLREVGRQAPSRKLRRHARAALR